MKRLQLFILLLILYICKIGCSKKEAKINNTLTDVVLVFQKIPENWKLKDEKAGFVSMGKYEVSYTLIDGITYFYYPSNREEDTLVIKNIDSDIELQHKYMGIDLLSFIIEPGDTILFTYRDKRPVITVKNRKTSSYDYTYEQIRYDSIIKDSLSSWAKYKAPPLFLKKEDEDLIAYNLSSYNKATAEIVSEKKFLHSKNKYFSPNVLSFYTNRIIYRDKMLELKNRKFIPFNEIEQKDELLKYSYYREFIDFIMSKHIHYKVQSDSKGEKPTRIYDYVKQNNSLSTKTKEYLLFKYMHRIIEHCSNEEIQKYWNLFKKDCSANISKIDYLESLYNLQDNLSEQLFLKDLNGKTTSLENLLKKYDNKVIYIDFWASWCNPCRMMLPESKKLHKEFQDVVFIYLALKDKQMDWKKACREEKLYENSYWIENSKSSTFITKMRINTIPHYMIYGKDGKLYQNDSPRPNTNEIRKILKDLTK